MSKKEESKKKGKKDIEDERPEKIKPVKARRKEGRIDIEEERQRERKISRYTLAGV